MSGENIKTFPPRRGEHSQILNENLDFDCAMGPIVCLSYIHLDDGLCEEREQCDLFKALFFPYYIYFLQILLKPSDSRFAI